MNKKLTEQDVIAILDLVSTGVPQKDLARDYGVCPATISLLVTGRSWPNIPRPQRESSTPRRSKLSLEDVETILQRLALGEVPGSIAPDFGVSRQTIANIKANKTWQQVPRPSPQTRKKVWEASC